MTEGPDWITGDPVSLRAWRAAQPEVVAPSLPEGVRIGPPPPTLPAGLLCTPDRIEHAGLILHFHGGGFFVGSPWTHRVVGAWIASVFAMPVLLAEYPLAPENVLPAQAIAAAASLQQAARTGPILLSGDSAGALVAMLAYHWAEAPTAIQGLIAHYGIFGARGSCEGSADDEPAGLGPRSLAAAYRRIDPRGMIGTDPELTPLDIRFRLPRHTLAVFAEHDPVRSESLALQASRPSDVTLVEAHRLGHGFLSAVQPAPEAVALLHRIKAMSERAGCV